MSYRSFGTNRSGFSFDVFTRIAVWRKALVVPGADPSLMRKDSCGAWMKWADYGQKTSEFGWEIDHVVPVARGGSDSLENLQPLQWQNNRHKGDSWPQWSCVVRAA